MCGLKPPRDAFGRLQRLLADSHVPSPTVALFLPRQATPPSDIHQHHGRTQHRVVVHRDDDVAQAQGPDTRERTPAQARRHRGGGHEPAIAAVEVRAKYGGEQAWEGAASVDEAACADFEHVDYCEWSEEDDARDERATEDGASETTGEAYVEGYGYVSTFFA